MAEKIINGKKVKRIDADGNEKIYDCVKMAAADNGIYANQIARGVRLGKPVKGFMYEYIEEKKDFYIPLTNPVWNVAKENFNRKPYYLAN